MASTENCLDRKEYVPRLLASCVIGMGLIIAAKIVQVNLLPVMNNSFLDHLYTAINCIIPAVVASLAAIFGPISGALFCLLEIIVRDSWFDHFEINIVHSLFRVITPISILYGVSIGLLWKYLKIGISKLTVRKLINFNIVQIAANLLFRDILLNVALGVPVDFPMRIGNVVETNIETSVFSSLFLLLYQLILAKK